MSDFLFTQKSDAKTDVDVDVDVVYSSVVTQHQHTVKGVNFKRSELSCTLFLIKAYIVKLFWKQFFMY